MRRFEPRGNPQASQASLRAVPPDRTDGATWLKDESMRRGIDHLVLCVRDLEAAIARYGALGFTTTPRAEHPWGTANSLAQLDGNFLELLSVVRTERIVEPAPGHFSFGAFNREFVAKREGLSMLVFESEDAHADRDAFRANGLDTYFPFHFERLAPLPNGSKATVGFSLAFVTDERLPEAAFFTCQQHAPKHFWNPDYQRHANGARQLVEVVMVANDPPSLADLYAALEEPGAVEVRDGLLDVSTGRGTVTVVIPAAFHKRFGHEPVAGIGPRLVAYVVAVTDLATATALLERNEVPHARRDGMAMIAPEDAFGVTIALVQDD
jgi:catechol 2,3-dioxygenase-like lactoylglutathione lyase family enzyme